MTFALPVNEAKKPVVFAAKEGTTMKFAFVAIMAILIGFFTQARAEGAEQKPLDVQRFANQALAMNEFEIKSAEIVLDTGNAEESIAYAKDMMQAHRRAGTLLAKAVANEGLHVSPRLTKLQEQKLRALRQSDAANFDQSYFADQILAHQQAVRLFSTYMKNGQPGPLRTLAEQLMPELRTHLIRVQGLTSP